jgi:hypothetical protein
MGPIADLAGLPGTLPGGAPVCRGASLPHLPHAAVSGQSHCQVEAALHLVHCQALQWRPNPANARFSITLKNSHFHIPFKVACCYTITGARPTMYRGVHYRMEQHSMPS